MSSQPPLHYFSYDRLAELLAESLPPDTEPGAIESIVKRLSEIHTSLEQTLTERTINLIPNESKDFVHEHTAQVLALAIQLETRYRQLPENVTALVEIARACLLKANLAQGGSS